MRDQARDRIVRAAHVAHMQRVLVIPERANVGNLSAGFGIKRCAVEDDFALAAGRQFVHRAVFGDNRFDAEIARRRSKIKVRLGAIRFRELCINGIRNILTPALP
jgi:hypothetical protein